MLQAAQTMLMFLVPVTFVVHDFWSTAKFVSPKQVCFVHSVLLWFSDVNGY